MNAKLEICFYCKYEMQNWNRILARLKVGADYINWEPGLVCEADNTGDHLFIKFEERISARRANKSGK